MRLRIAVVTALAVVVTVLEAQSIDPALAAAITGRDEAAIKRDPAALAKYTADDYASINPTGGRMTKQQRVDQLKIPAAPGSKPAQPMRTEAVRMYGAGAAVVRMKQIDNRQLQLWIKNPAGWQAVAIHVVPDVFLPVASPGDRPKTPEPSALTTPSGLTGDRAAVFAAFKRIQDAFFRGDGAEYNKLTASEHARLNPGLIRFSPEGPSAFDGLPRAQPKFSNISVQSWNQVAVVRWLETGRNGVQWLTRIFANGPAGWQQVATASSLAATPPIQSTQP